MTAAKRSTRPCSRELCSRKPRYKKEPLRSKEESLRSKEEPLRARIAVAAAAAAGPVSVAVEVPVLRLLSC